MKLFIPAVIAALALACGTKTTPPGDGGVTCQNDPRVQQYSPPIVQTSTDGSVKISLSQSNPAPPALYGNTWTVTITDASGNAINSSGITLPKPYMPDHGHFSDQTPTVVSKGSGNYEIDDVYFFMAGVWQTTFLVPTTGQCGGAPGPGCEGVVFTLCVAG
jgi:hypothetical protein